MIRDFQPSFTIDAKPLLQGGAFDANTKHVSQWDDVSNTWELCEGMHSLSMSYAGILLLDILACYQNIESIRLGFDSKDRGCQDGLTFVCLCIESVEIALSNGDVCDDKAAYLFLKPFCEAIQENDFLASLFAQSSGSLLIKRSWVERFIGQAVVDGAEVCEAIAEQAESGLKKLVFH